MLRSCVRFLSCWLGRGENDASPLPHEKRFRQRAASQTACCRRLHPTGQGKRPVSRERSLFVGSGINLPAGVDTRVAGIVQNTHHVGTQIGAYVHRQRTRAHVQVRRRGRAVYELWIGKPGVGVLSRNGLIAGVARNESRLPIERSAARSRSIKPIVVIEAGGIRRGTGEVVYQQALRPINDVVLEDVVGRVILDLEFALSGYLCRVVVECVVDNGDMVRSSYSGRVPSDGDARAVHVIDHVVSDGNVAGHMTGVLAGCLVDIYIMHQVALDNDARAAVDIESVRAPAIAFVDRIVARADVVDAILNVPAVARLVERRVRRLPFETDEVHSDVVIVMDEVIGLDPVLHVAVQRYGLAAPCGVVVDFVATKGDVIDRSRCPGAVDRNRECVGAAATAACRNDVMDVVIQDLEIVPGTLKIDAHSRRAARGPVIPDLESLNDDVAVALEIKQAVLTSAATATYTGAVDSGGFAGVAHKGDVSRSCIPGVRKGDLLVV